MSRAVRLAVVAALTVGLVGEAAAASSGSVEQQLEALRQAIERQQAMLEEQQQQIAAQRAEIEALRAASGAAAAAAARSQLVAQDSPRVQMVASRPTITSADGRSSISIRANVQVDVAQHLQDPPGAPALDFRRGSVGAGNRENDAARDLSDGAYFRRARLGIEGTIARDWNYRFLMEFGGAGTEGPTRINDAFIAYTGLAPFVIQAGAFSPPANLADGTSTEDLLFIERASPAELSRALGGADGRLGLGVRAGGARWLGALTFTGRSVNEAEVFDTQSAIVGRFGGLVATAPDYNVHLGANGTWVLHAADQALGSTGRYLVRFRERPELRVDSTRLIDTGAIDPAHAYSAGVEFAANWKNLLLQGEHYWYGAERRESALPDPKFGGYYVEASWLITGERRRYAPASAAFQAPKPRIPFDGDGGWGAWELGLRYSHTDLDYREGVAGTAAPLGSVRGGEQSIVALGLNWYLNSNVRLMLNWLHVDVDRLNPAGPGNPTPFGAGPATPPLGAQIGQQYDVYAVRSQFAF